MKNSHFSKDHIRQGGGFAKHILMALILVVVILCLSIALTVLCRQVYYFDIGHLDIPARSGISAETCRENYDVLIDYNLIGGPAQLEFPDFIMSEQGRIHFEEVKHIFVAAQWIALGGLILFICRLLWQRHRGDRDYRWLRLTSWIALAMVAAVGGLVAVSWDTAFVLMHKILFNNDLWIFNAATDPIIRILPDTFFMHCGILIMALMVVFVLGCRLLARRLEQPR